MLHLIGSLITGSIIGWIAGKIMDTDSGLLRNIIVGIIGSFIGSFLAGILGFYAFGWFANLIVSVVGACIFIWLGRRLFQ